MIIFAFQKITFAIVWLWYKRWKWRQGESLEALNLSWEIYGHSPNYDNNKDDKEEGTIQKSYVGES